MPLNKETKPIKCLEEVALTWIKRVGAGRTYVLQQDFSPCCTNPENPILAVWKLLQFRNPLTLQIEIFLIIICGAQRNQRPSKTSCNTKDELKTRITAKFTNLNKETVVT